MPKIKVTDGQGNTHVFPDGTTPQMIEEAMGLGKPAPTGAAGFQQALKDAARPKLPDLSGTDRYLAAIGAKIPTPTQALSTLGTGAKGLATGAILSAAETLPEKTVINTSKTLNSIPFIGEYLAPSAGVASMEKHGLPKPEGTLEKIGAGIETGAEFVAGSAALGGVTKAAPGMAKLLAAYPKLAPLLLGAVEGAVVGGAQGGIREGTIKGVDEGIGMGMAAGAVGGLVKGIPRTGRAGKTLNEVNSVVGNAPVNPSAAATIAQEAEGVAHRGGVQLPQVMRSLLDDAANGQITFKQMSDYITGAGGRLSQNEAAGMTKPMQKVMNRYLSKFYGALRRSQQEVADVAGVGDKFKAGIREYASASNMKEGVKAGAKQAAKTVGAGAALGGTYAVYDALKRMAK